MFRYILTGDGMMSVPIHSEMNWLEMDEHMRKHTKKLHPKGQDRVYRLGTIEFINPHMKSVEDFMNFLPHML